MSGPRLTMPREYAEKSTLKVSGTISDEDGNVPTLSAFTLTLYDEDTGTIINSVSATNILNTGRGTYSDTTGAFTILLTPDDMAIVTTTATRERHILLLEYTYGSTKKGKQEIAITVKNLAKVA